jgi:hypothetical protein
MWVTCHNGMARPQNVDGGDDLQIWRTAEKVLNVLFPTSDKGRPSSLRVVRGARNCL